MAFFPTSEPFESRVVFDTIAATFPGVVPAEFEEALDSGIPLSYAISLYGNPFPLSIVPDMGILFESILSRKTHRRFFHAVSRERAALRRQARRLRLKFDKLPHNPMLSYNPQMEYDTSEVFEAVCLTSFVRPRNHRNLSYEIINLLLAAPATDHNQLQGFLKSWAKRQPLITELYMLTQSYYSDSEKREILNEARKLIPDDKR
jgi:hypothetical protein